MDLERVHASVQRNRPLGTDAWVTRTAARLGLTHMLGSEGRPRKEVVCKLAASLLRVPRARAQHDW
jgi:hypothetical protein